MVGGTHGSGLARAVHAISCLAPAIVTGRTLAELRDNRLDPCDQCAETGGLSASPQIRSGTISIAPQGHSETQIPHPLQKS
jgi:hypothetical protein